MINILSPLFAQVKRQRVGDNLLHSPVDAKTLSTQVRVDALYYHLDFVEIFLKMSFPLERLASNVSLFILCSCLMLICL